MASPGIDSIGDRRTPERNSPLFDSPIIFQAAPTHLHVTSGTTPVTLTAAQLLTQRLNVDCQDTGTLTLPTADLLAAAIPGLAKDQGFDFWVVNEGDSALTIAVGTGITLKVLTNSVDGIVTVATMTSGLFSLVCTGIADPSDPSKSNTFDLYRLALGGTVLS